MLAKLGISSSALTVVLVGLATIIVQSAMTLPETSNAVPLLNAVVALLIAIVLRRGKIGSLNWSERRYLVPLAMGCFMAWPIIRGVLGSVVRVGRPLELVLLGVLQGTALGLLAVPAGRGRRDVLAITASVFSVVFATTMSPTPEVRILTLAFAGIATTWLGSRPRDDCPTTFIAANGRSGWGQTAAIAVGFGCLVATAVIARPQGLAARWGWLASSGGTDSYDPFARSGVGDGDALVRAENDASSVAPIADTNVFLATDTPSLYDMFNDMYGEPPRPKKTERAVPLPADLTPRDEQQVATSKQAGREFSAVRQPPKGRGLKDRESPAVLHLAGRTPAHLRMIVFDVFDGQQWYPADKPASSPRLTMKNHSDVPWLCVKSSHQISPEAAYERHSLKILALDTASIPLFAETAYLKIDHVPNAEYFGWQQDGVVRMEGRERIPPLTVIDLLSDFSTGSGTEIASNPPNDQASSGRERSLPISAYSSQLKSLAIEWTSDRGSPAEAVAAVVGRLRAGFIHDPTVIASPSTTDAVAEFLFQQKRGPDYLFATSAAILLRHLGYRTRVVSGFYASPVDYDRRSGLTSVMPDNVHFWAEWRDVDGCWRSLEPTPGYELLQPRITWRQLLAGAVIATRNHLHENWPLFLAGVIAAIAVCLNRFRLADQATEWIWRLGTARQPVSTVAWTLRVLDWRAAIAGRRRDRGSTLHQWLSGITTKCTGSDAVREPFLDHLAISLYGPTATFYTVAAEAQVALQRRHRDCLHFLQTCRAERMRVQVTILDRAESRLRALMRRMRRSATGTEGFQ